MGRRSSSGPSRSYSTGLPKFRSTPSLSKKSTLKKPAKEEKAPPPGNVETATHGISRRGRFFSSISDGFGFALGYRMVEGIFGPRTIRQEIVLPEKVEVAAIATKDDNEKLKDYSESCSISYNSFQEVSPKIVG